MFCDSGTWLRRDRQGAIKDVGYSRDELVEHSGLQNDGGVGEDGSNVAATTVDDEGDASLLKAIRNGTAVSVCEPVVEYGD
jgi:hypothetical protein